MPHPYQTQRSGQIIQVVDTRLDSKSPDYLICWTDSQQYASMIAKSLNKTDAQ